MSKELFDKGLAVRKEVLGKDYVEGLDQERRRVHDGVQDITTEYCWGYVWSRPGLDKKTRSMLNLAMLSALNRGPELRLHINRRAEQRRHQGRDEGDFPPGRHLLRDSGLPRRLQDGEGLCSRNAASDGSRAMSRGARVEVRAARPGEEALLSAICWRSKQHWGYDAAFMRQSAASLAVPRVAIDDGHVWVAVDPEGQPLGVVQLAIVGSDLDLDKLFVEPSAIGAGIGEMLFRRAVAEARRRGHRRMTVLADPNAAGFYERMGCRFDSMAPSDAIPGRELPLYVFDLAKSS
jgi:GNAT superfamily N-acetyltransferase